jgi:hypothetical protein
MAVPVWLGCDGVRNFNYLVNYNAGWVTEKDALGRLDDVRMAGG